MIKPLFMGVAGAILLLSAAQAADYPAPQEADWIARDFKFHTGEVMPELRLHYTTIGEATGQPVMILHGTGGSAKSLLTPQFANELFGPGSPLDASKYFIILPDAFGHGRSSKPSDGLRMKFPQYYIPRPSATVCQCFNKSRLYRHFSGSLSFLVPRRPL